MDDALGNRRNVSSEQRCIRLDSLPDISLPEMTFRQTSFFRQDPNRALPSPEYIFEQRPGFGTGVFTFPELNLAVKIRCDYDLRLEEAQALWAVGKAYHAHEIPVPELFGWKRYDGRTFLYMSLVQGEHLYEAWPALTLADKESICAQLSNIVRRLRTLTREPLSSTICKSLAYPPPLCSINGGSVQDRFFRDDYELGPLNSAQEYNNLLLAAATRQKVKLDGYVDGPYRDLLPDDDNIYFAHGDLTPGNIMVVGHPGSITISGIIDWEQAGWYPAYWEYCKLFSGVDYLHEWREAGWIDKLMDTYPDAWWAIAEYLLWRCP